MLPFSYEDRFPDQNVRGGYGATNEEPLLIRDAVKPFNHGLGIASGGEVALLSLLPKTRQSLVLVDHSYSSIRSFCMKALLLATRGPQATRKLLVDSDTKGWHKVVEELLPHLPTSLVTAKNITELFLTEATNIRREWYYADLLSLKRATARLNLVKLIHGDLLDTTDRAPYDFVYLSNALEHTGRLSTPMKNNYGTSSSHPDPAALTSKLMKKGSRILWVEANGSSYGSNRKATEAWPILSKTRGYRTSWVYNLGLYS